MSVPGAFLKSLHPKGAAPRVAGIGNAVPDGIATMQPTVSAYDAIVLAPDADEIVARGRIQTMIAKARTSLADDGIVYAIVPPLHRWRLAAQLRAHGFPAVQTYLQPVSGRTWLLCPVNSQGLRVMRTTWPLSPRWKAIERMLSLSRWSAPLLSQLLPSVVLVARKDKAGTDYWLSAASGQTVQPLIATSWRSNQGGAVVFAIPVAGGQPQVLAKYNSGNRAESTMSEADALHLLFPASTPSSLRLPRPLGNAGNDWSLQSVVSGRTLAMLLNEDGTGFDLLRDSVRRAILAWNLESCARTVLVPDLVDRWLMEPLDVIARDLGPDHDYRRRLEIAARSLLGRKVTIVAAHNDCSVANLIWDARQGLGLIDWETATADAPPLGDLAYSLCDLEHHSQGVDDRTAAFRSCFVAGAGADASSRSRFVQDAITWKSAVGDEWPWLSLAFHACWLMHARNEKLADSGKERPFLSIVQEMARWPQLTPPAWSVSLPD